MYQGLVNIECAAMFHLKLLFNNDRGWLFSSKLAFTYRDEI